MSDNKENKGKLEIDLSTLQDMEFSPAWTPSTNYSKFERGDKGTFNKRPFKGGREGGKPREFQNREFKPREFKPREFKPRENSEGRPPRREFTGGDRKPGFGRPRPGGARFSAPQQFHFTMEALFYPEDAPFAKLADVMKHLKRTYQLFDIAELVIEKPERFIVLAKNLPGADGVVKPLYCAQPQNLPFDDEEGARKVAIDHYIAEMFEQIEVEVEAPKGNFQVIHRTKLNGALLGAPNWHGYGAYVREYHMQNFPNMPYERFMTTIESVRDEEQLAAWTEMMKKRIAYKLKDSEETFETRTLAAAYIVEQKGEELVKTYEQVRMHGSDIALLPFGSRIRRNIENEWAKQKRFPIITANNLRGRLRRAGFSIYKRGSKGFAFVSAVKRKFLLEGDSLSENPQKIYDFVMQNQGIKAGELPFAFLGIKAPKDISKAAPLAEEHKKQAEGEEVSQPVEVVEDVVQLSAEEAKMLKNISNDLLWLISEGYVVEYADSSLQANPRLPRPKEKTSKTIASDAESVMLGVEDEPIVSQTVKAPKEDVSAEEVVEETGDSCAPYGSECSDANVIMEADTSAEEPEAAAAETAEEPQL